MFGAPPRRRTFGEFPSPIFRGVSLSGASYFARSGKVTKTLPGTLRSRPLRLLPSRAVGLTHRPSKKPGVPLKYRCKGDTAAVARALKPTDLVSRSFVGLRGMDGLPWGSRTVDPASPPTSEEYIGRPTLVVDLVSWVLCRRRTVQNL